MKLSFVLIKRTLLPNTKQVPNVYQPTFQQTFQRLISQLQNDYLQALLLLCFL